MDTQESIIIIIKDDNKLLLQKNLKWNDYSFIGGKCEEKDLGQPIRSAYREVMEELDIMGGLDFVLQPIQTAPIEFDKYSKRTESERHYKFYVFLLKANNDIKSKLNTSENQWIFYKNINSFEKQEYPISDLVKDILQKIEIDVYDSFKKGQKEIEEEYRKTILDAIHDEYSHGIIDDIERRLLNQKKKELAIPDLRAKQIEDMVFSEIKKDNCRIVVNEHLQKLLTKFVALKNDLTIYGGIRRLNSVQITNVYNEGKTGALVFQVACKKTNDVFNRILKYDYYPRILKESKAFKKNERFHGVFASPKCEPYLGNEEQNYAFLELQPADEFANATEMLSLKKIVQTELKNYASDVFLKNYLMDAIKDIVDWLFRRVYKTDNQETSYIKQNTYYMDSIDHFLPPRKLIDGIYTSSEESLSGEFIQIQPKNIISYDIKRDYKTNNSANVTFKVWLKIDGALNRVDVLINLDASRFHFLDNTDEWKIWIKKEIKGKNERESKFSSFKAMFQNLDFEKYQLYDAFSSIPKKNLLSTGQKIDSILQKKGIVYLTDTMHGDLNPSNILLCKLSTGKFHPILIDFYDSGIRGNLFFDLARFETEIVILLLNNNLKTVFSLSSDESELSEDAIQMILKLEENLFELKNMTEIFKGDFILFEIRKILIEIVSNQLKSDYYTFDWYKNYILCIATFSASFLKFNSESNLNKLIAGIWSMRALARIDKFENYIESGFLKEKLQEDFSKLTKLNPLQKFIEQCRKENNWTRIEMGIEKISPDLFINYYFALSDYLDKFINQKERNSFFIIGDRGIGKTIFLDTYFSSDQFLYPVLYVPGEKLIEDTNGFIHFIKQKLDLAVDWLQTIHFYIEDSDYYFCIVIDNISFNPKPELAVEALKTLIQATYNSRVKVIISATETFWNDYLDNDEIIPKTNYKFPDKSNSSKLYNFYALELGKIFYNEKKELLSKYFKKYSINGELFGSAFQIAANPGLLKLFCEINKNKDIGKIDQIFLLEMIENYVEYMHKHISIVMDTNKNNINAIFLIISKELLSKRVYSLPIDTIFEITKKSYLIPDNTYFQKFINSTILSDYMTKYNHKIGFKFPEIAAYLLANEIIQEWLPKGAKMNLDWIEIKLKNIKKDPINETILYYVMVLLYKTDAVKFNEFLNQLVRLFDNSPYYILGIISKSISTLPKLSSRSLKSLSDLEGKIRIIEMKRKSDKILMRQISSYYYRINVEYSKDAQIWVENFETRNPTQILSILEYKLNQEQLGFIMTFIVRDYNNGGHFIRNFIKPLFPQLIENPLEHEEIILELCNRFFEFKNFEGEFGEFIYNSLINIVDIHYNSIDTRKYWSLALKMLSAHKIKDNQILIKVLNKFNEWSYLMYTDSNAQIEMYNEFLRFLLLYNNFENPIDYQCFENLKRVIPIIQYEKLNVMVKKKIETYLIHGLPLTIQVIEMLIKKYKDLDQRFRLHIESNKGKMQIESQNVLYVIIKQDENLLLQYKPKWNDYSWLGTQIKSEDYSLMDKISKQEYEEKLCIQVISEKLNLVYPDHFELQKNRLEFPPFDNFSRSRNKLVRYSPVFYIIKLKHPYLLEKIELFENNKFFKLEELIQPGNIMISAPVKNIVLQLKRVWNKIPNTIY